jgi:hypothetical protein
MEALHMEPHSRSFRWARLLAALVLAALVGLFAYNAGVAHGVAAAASQQIAASPQGAPQPGVFAPYYGPYGPYGYYRPWGFGFFFGPFFFLLLFFLVLRGLLWGGRWRRYGYYPRGYYDGPAAFDEWHRRAHERMTQQPGGPAHDDDRSRS